MPSVLVAGKTVDLAELLDRRGEGRLRFRPAHRGSLNRLVEEERPDALVVDVRSIQGRLSGSYRVRESLASDLPVVFVVGGEPGAVQRLRTHLLSPRVDFVRMPVEMDAPADEIVGRLERLLHQVGRDASPPPHVHPEPRHAAPELRSPLSGRIDAARVARLLGIPLSELARLLGKRPGTVAKTPDAPSLQSGLRVYERIAAPLMHLAGGPERMRAWLNVPHPSLGGETPLALIREGHGEAIAGLVERMAVGEPA